jgi:hypothetical protein
MSQYAAIGSSENSGRIQYIPEFEFGFSRKIAAQLEGRADELVISAVDAFGGEAISPKSKLKIAPEFFGAEFVVAVLQNRSLAEAWFKLIAYINPEAVCVKGIATPPFVVDICIVPRLFGTEIM